MNRAIDAVHIDERPGGPEALLRAEPPQSGTGIAWLGQAGFLLRTRQVTLLVDPYLSDSLARKYKGREFPHERMMPPPVQPEDLTGVDIVLCTHRHTDHMDPGTLPVILEQSPECRLVVPRSALEHAVSMGLPSDCIVCIDDGIILSLDGLTVEALPSAHEEIEVNARGEQLYLGYILRLQDVTLYHSGDCVPYPGVPERLAKSAIDLALLPVNGRDAFRRERGVPGNMDIDEAIDLCWSADIPILLVHHFGMFDFNTADPGGLRDKLRREHKITGIVPSTDRHWVSSTVPPDTAPNRS